MVEVADLCDIIQVFVSDDTALLEVVRTIAAALSPRHLIAAHATVSPKAARQAAAIVESQGARYLDAPFTGSKMAAQNRQLNYYVGGTQEALEEARPILEVTARKVLHVGGVGDASVIKIATNMLTAATVQTLAEALTVVRAAGIDGQRLVDALEFNGSRSGTSDLKLPAMLAEDFDPNFSLKHMLKDVRLALGLAEDRKIPTPVASAMENVFADGIEKQWGDLDFSVVVRNYDEFLPPRPATCSHRQHRSGSPGGLTGTRVGGGIRDRSRPGPGGGCNPRRNPSCGPGTHRRRPQPAEEKHVAHSTRLFQTGVNRGRRDAILSSGRRPFSRSV